MQKLIRVLMAFALLFGFLGATQASEKESEKYVVKKGDSLSLIANAHKATGTTWQQLAKENGIVNPNLIFPGQTILISRNDVVVARSTQITAPANPTPNVEVACAQTETPAQVGVASWYGEYHQGNQTASGEAYDMRTLTVAHPTLPFGTIICITNKKNEQSVIAKVNDRGPYVKPRIIDVSKRIAQHLGLIGPGTGIVSISILQRPHGKWVRPKFLETKIVRKDLASTQLTIPTTDTALQSMATTPMHASENFTQRADSLVAQNHRIQIRALLRESIGPPYDTRVIEDAMIDNERKAQVRNTFLFRD